MTLSLTQLHKTDLWDEICTHLYTIKLPCKVRFALTYILWNYPISSQLMWDFQHPILDRALKSIFESNDCLAKERELILISMYFELCFGWLVH